MALDLQAIARRAIDACDGEALTREAASMIDVRAKHVHVIGAGKAAGQMARGAVEGLTVAPTSALAITKDHAFGGFASSPLEVAFAGHPAPDARSAAAGGRVIAALERRRVDELVVFVLSGGASSLLACPVAGISPADLTQTSRALVGSGLPIDDINLVRQQLTRLSAGRLITHCVARVEVLVLSDVVSGDLAAVGSGPWLPSRGSAAEALECIADVPGVPTTVRAFLGAVPEASMPPAEDDPRFARVRHRVLATPARLGEAAADLLRESEAEVVHLPPTTRDCEAVAEHLMRVADGLPPAGVIVSSGEPTVVLPPSPGRGGRNLHLALMMAKRIAGTSLTFVSVGSDGSDGVTDAAGAVVDGGTWARLVEHGDPDDALARADAFTALDRVGALVRTGPTGTNLCDLHLLGPGSGEEAAVVGEHDA